MPDLQGNPFFLTQEAIQWVQDTLASMTQEEKIGQLFCPHGDIDPAVIQKEMLDKKVGGIMFRPLPGQAIQEVNRFAQSHSRIPLLIAANLEAGGSGTTTDGTLFGSQMQVAATDDPEQAYRLGFICGTEARAVGCNWAFAPVVDIDYNFRNPITNTRTYGSDPERVLKMARAYVRGAKEAGIAVSIKHFPGDGRDERDQHLVTSINDSTCLEWDATYGRIYGQLIADGAQTVMAGHIALPDYQKALDASYTGEIPIPATLSKALLTDLLRKKLRFNGLIVTDATEMVGFASALPRKDAVPGCIAAGCDMFLFNKDVDEDFEYMREGVRKGIISPERLDEAVTRILALKASLGLQNRNENVPAPESLQLLHQPRFQQWARECADRSVTLVKDTQHLLPLSSQKTPKVLLTFYGAGRGFEPMKQLLSALFEKEGFQITIFTPEDGKKNVKDGAEVFKKHFDLSVIVADVETYSNQTTARIQWHTVHGSNGRPWYVKEVPTLLISTANPYVLLDAPMVRTFVNTYSAGEEVLKALMEKLMGRSSFKGKSPIDPFCGNRWDLRQ